MPLLGRFLRTEINWISSNTIINLATSYRGEMSRGTQWRAAFNITNLLDREPSIVTGSNGQGTIPGHDSLDSRCQFGVNMVF